MRHDYLEVYLRSSGAIRWDPESIGPLAVSDRVARVVWSLACIEVDSSSQAAKIEQAGFTRAPDVGAFLPRWYAEEQEHGRFLFTVAERCGLPPPDRPRLSTEADQRGQPRFGMLALLGRFPGADAAYLVTAAAAEYTARFMYSWLAAQFAATPLVADTFRSLAVQEARHLGFYRSGAEARLERSALARQGAPRMMARWWRPVGIDTLGWDAWWDTFGELLRDRDLQRQLLNVDRMVASLPGFERAAPMRSFLLDHDVELA